MSRSLSLAGSKAMQVNSMIVLHKSIILLRFYLLFWECHGLAELEFDWSSLWSAKDGLIIWGNFVSMMDGSSTQDNEAANVLAHQ